MAWVVDTCVLIDIAENDPQFGHTSAACLQKYSRNGLVVCPVTSVELAPVFLGHVEHLRAFYETCGVMDSEPFDMEDTEAAFTAWNRYVLKKRTGHVPKRPIADILIGGFALRFDGLITRNHQDFAQTFPKLKLILPGKQ